MPLLQRKRLGPPTVRPLQGLQNKEVKQDGEV